MASQFKSYPSFNYGQANQAYHAINPSTAKYHREFVNGAHHLFYTRHRKSYYAWLYGSFSESLSWNDFFHCYLMGGEL